MRTFIWQDNCVDDLMIYCVKMRGVACCFWQSYNQAFNNLHLLNMIMLMIDQLLYCSRGVEERRNKGHYFWWLEINIHTYKLKYYGSTDCSQTLSFKWIGKLEMDIVWKRHLEKCSEIGSTNAMSLSKI